MRIINIIDRFDKVNFGIWNAAIATALVLKKHYNVDSELWYPKTEFKQETHIVEYQLDISETIDSLILAKNLNPKTDIIVTHGCWQYPTRWGYEFKKRGFKWIYVPHGMLEPWSMLQKRFKKLLYYHLVEKRQASKADSIRAVGKPEHLNLQKKFTNTILIPNGCEITSNINKTWEEITLHYLFMARLHQKKGIVPLIKAWKKSQLYNNPSFKLTIAGPDDGELPSVQAQLTNEVKNIEYVGAVYGTEKTKLLEKGHFYILPSHSEGFPTSVVEAMQYGLIPIISEGCNFPEAFENNLAIKTYPAENNIVISLDDSVIIELNSLKKQSADCKLFIKDNYSLEKIADQQYQLYSQLLNDAN